MRCCWYSANIFFVIFQKIKQNNKKQSISVLTSVLANNNNNNQLYSSSLLNYPAVQLLMTRKESWDSAMFSSCILSVSSV